MSLRDTGVKPGEIGVCSNVDAPETYTKPEAVWGKRRTRAVVGVEVLDERDAGLFGREVLVEHLFSMDPAGPRGDRWWTSAANVYREAAELYAAARGA